MKSFVWSAGPDFPTQFYLERTKPSGSSVVLSVPSPTMNRSAFVPIIDDVEDFQVKKDFMFATKKNGKVCSYYLFQILI